MRASEWLREAEIRLAEAGIAEAALDARLLLQHALGVDRAFLVAHPDTEVHASAESVLHRRLQREPLAYILGYREFYGRPFKVTQHTLIPRQETETVLDSALQGRTLQNVLDLGTGSGCLGISLKLERPDADVLLSDISPETAKIAIANALALKAKVGVVVADGVSAFADGRFDLILTNPPYVETDAPLEPEVKAFEPHLALFAGKDGMDFYRRLAREAARVLAPGGKLVVEIGDGQLEAVTTVFQSSWTVADVRMDLLDHPRAVTLIPN